MCNWIKRHDNSVAEGVTEDDFEDFHDWMVVAIGMGRRRSYRSLPR